MKKIAAFLVLSFVLIGIFSIPRAHAANSVYYIQGITSKDNSMFAASAEGAFNTPTATPVPQPIVQYSAPTQETSVGAPFLTTTLSYGLKNNADVMKLQVFLSQKGYFTVAPDGNFGPKTLAAVKAFQLANNLPPIGLVGPQTRALIR